MVVLCKVNFSAYGVDIVDGLGLGGPCCHLFFIRRLHWGKVQAGAAITGANHVDSVGGTDCFHFILAEK